MSKKADPILNILAGAFLVLVVVGLRLSSSGSHAAQDIMLNENSRLSTLSGKAEKEAGQANERASTNELAAKQLDIQLNETKTQLAKAETRLIELQNANLPMDIGEQLSFAIALKSLPGIKVELRAVADLKAERTADDFLTVFGLAGWTVINRGGIGDIGEEGIAIGYELKDASSKSAAQLLLRLLTERNVPSKMLTDEDGFRVRAVPTNGIIVAVCQRPSRLNTIRIIVEAQRTILEQKTTALTEHLQKVGSRMMELATTKFPKDSKALADAQSEYNDLNARFPKLQTEEQATMKQESALILQGEDLWRQYDKELKQQRTATNSPTNGLIMYGNRSVVPLQ